MPQELTRDELYGCEISQFTSKRRATEWMEANADKIEVLRVSDMQGWFCVVMWRPKLNQSSLFEGESNVQ